MKAVIRDLFRVLLAVLIPLASFVTGLAARSAGRKRLWRRPAALAWALLAVMVAVPLWVIVLVKLAPLSPMVGGGLLIATLSIGIGPMAGVKRMSGDNPAANDALDLNLVVLLLSLLRPLRLHARWRRCSGWTCTWASCRWPRWCWDARWSRC